MIDPSVLTIVLSHNASVSTDLLTIPVSGRRTVVVGVGVVAVRVSVVAVIVVAVVGLRRGEPVGADLPVGVAVVVAGWNLENLGPS